MPRRQPPRAEPLRPAVFHILLALAAGDRHGLGIAEEIERTSGGTLELGPGTLYRSLAEMAQGGLIRSVTGPAAEADPRRKHYRITAAGRAAVAAEARRLQVLVGAARARRLISDPT
jgi:DNA-binding PadR family transcriptional regulator